MPASYGNDHDASTAMAHQPVSPVQLNRQEARLLVEGIAHDHGYVPPDVLEAMAPEHRWKIEKALNNKDDIIGSSVFTYV
jgi:hypothetical protein